MAEFGCLDVFIKTVRQFHDGRMPREQDPDQYSVPFNVTAGVKQDCFLALTLFIMMFAATLTDAFKDSDVLVKIRNRLKW